MLRLLDRADPDLRQLMGGLPIQVGAGGWEHSGSGAWCPGCGRTRGRRGPAAWLSGKILLLDAWPALCV